MHMSKTLVMLSFVLSLTARGAEPLKLFPGWPVAIGEAERATSADPAVATTTLTGQKLTVTGKKEGRTTITVTHRGGATEALSVEVQASGWKLTPVVVAARDLAEGTELTPENLEQRSVPAFVVTTSVVTPEAVNYVLHQRVQAPIQAGDMLLWSLVAAKSTTAPK